MTRLRPHFALLTLPAVLLLAFTQAAFGATFDERLMSGEINTIEAAQKEMAALPEEDVKKAVSRLARHLRSAETDQRERAAQGLSLLGPAAQDAVQALRGALSDEFPYVRTRAAQALSRMGPAAVPAFIDALKNDNGDVRGIAASALGQYGSSAEPAIPTLILALKDKDMPVRERAAHALGQIGASSALPLLDFIENNTGSSKMLAIQAMGKIQTTDSQVVPRLIRVLEDSDSQIRLATVKALGQTGTTHIPELMAGLQSGIPTVRAQVADVFGDIGRKGSVAVPSLIELLKDLDPAVRASAARAIGHMGSSAGQAAVPALKTLLNDEDRNVVARTREALTNLTTAIEPVEVNPEKQRLLKAPDPARPPSPAVVKPVKKPPVKPPVKAAAKKPVKRLTVAQLIQMLQSTDELVHFNALKELIGMGDKAIPGLTTALQDGTTTVRQTVAQAFIQINSTAALHAFEECAKQGDLGVRLDALLALKSMGPQAGNALPALTQLLKDPSGEIQAAAVAVLEMLGSDDSKKVLEQYQKQQLQMKIASLLKDLRQGGDAGTDAFNALVKIGPPVVKPVAEVLGDPQVASRLAAAKILSELGPASAPATRELITALEDSETDVRRQAAEALGKINTPEAKKAIRFFAVTDWFRRLLKFFKR